MFVSIVSTAGIVYFYFGTVTRRPSLLMCGAALAVYPFLFTDIRILAGLGILFLPSPFVADAIIRRSGKGR